MGDVEKRMNELGITIKILVTKFLNALITKFKKKLYRRICTNLSNKYFFSFAKISAHILIR